MRRQIRHLTEVAKMPHVTIEIIPFSAGVYPAMERRFVALELPGETDDNVIYLESTIGEDIVEQREEILRYRDAFEELRRISLGPENSIGYLEKVINELR